jgi:hypothetical protein
MSETDTLRTDDAPKTNALIRANYKTKAAKYNAMRHHAREQERELAAASAEIDRLRNMTEHQWLLKVAARLVAAGCKSDGVVDSLDELIQQRDRLAEALRNCLPFITGDGCGEYSDAREALQSLTTNEQ